MKSKKEQAEIMRKWLTEENRGKKSEDRKKERSLQEMEKEREEFREKTEKIQSRSRLVCNRHQCAVSTEGGGRELVK